MDPTPEAAPEKEGGGIEIPPSANGRPPLGAHPPPPRQVRG